MTKRVTLEVSDYALDLGRPLGSGAYSDVFPHSTNPSRVLKVLRGEADVQKLRWLKSVSLTPSDPEHDYALPGDLAIDSEGRVVGYAMPAAPTGALDLEYVLGASGWLPMSYLIRVARNHARSVADLHRAGLVRGDLPNSLVTDAGAVFEVDLDSVACYENGLNYSCNTGKWEYAAPELIPVLESCNFRSMTGHDVWALGVVIFQLVMAGVHPFDCHWLGAGDRPKLTERVQSGLWPYGRRHADVEPKRDAPDYDQLPSELRQLFGRLFDRGALAPEKRPDIEDVVDVLDALDTGDDVTLSPEAWEVVRIGGGPPARRHSRSDVSRLEKPLAAASLLAAGAAAVWSGVVSAPVAPVGVVSELFSGPNFVSGSGQSPRDNLGEEQWLSSVSSSTPPPFPVHLYELEAAASGETPTLWQILRRRTR
ncbi:Protein kinase domain protein [Planctomycetes bacterium K2D]|uniref:Protein kinase domain protein n=1 Tax=Botrimarina mediterranea TaxID=2528022 RepID=A0A518K791_9BACT|nr:Protein kinase domain protein [Botrimarina mediterranea]QDV78253.1 Protein kinase domain protein [Planctomycetes bacterium K2D]